MTARNIRLAVIGGDGVGPEVVAEAIKVLGALDTLAIETTSYDLGSQRWMRTGEVLPDSVLAELAQHDAILLGAVGDPSVPSGLLERGLSLRLRFEFDQYVNLRPIRLYPGVASTLANVRGESVDMLVVREGTEGPYIEAGGFMRKGTPAEVATQESINTAFGVGRVARYALQRAAERPRHKLTLVHKSNVLAYAGDLWRRIVTEVAADFPEVATEYCHMDAAAVYFLTQPERFDVILTDNMFGDVLTSLGAAVAAASGWPPVPASIPSGRRRARSSLCTAARPTSLASRRLTRPRRFCLQRCCASTWVCLPRQHGSSRPSPRICSNGRAPGRRAPRRRSATTSLSGSRAEAGLTGPDEQAEPELEIVVGIGRLQLRSQVRELRKLTTAKPWQGAVAAVTVPQARRNSDFQQERADEIGGERARHPDCVGFPEPCCSQGGKHPLGRLQHADRDRPSRHRDHRAPRTRSSYGTNCPCLRPHLLQPAGIRQGNGRDTGQHFVGDSIQQCVLGGNEAVQRNHAAAQLGCQARHRDGFHALGLDQLDRGGDDALAR